MIENRDFYVALLTQCDWSKYSTEVLKEIICAIGKIGLEVKEKEEKDGGK